MLFVELNFSVAASSFSIMCNVFNVICVTTFRSTLTRPWWLIENMRQIPESNLHIYHSCSAPLQPQHEKSSSHREPRFLGWPHCRTRWWGAHWSGGHERGVEWTGACVCFCKIKSLFVFTCRSTDEWVSEGMKEVYLHPKSFHPPIIDSIHYR